MITIKGIADRLGVSRQTVYSLVKQAGLSLDSFTVEKRGNTRVFDDSLLQAVKQQRDTVKPERQAGCQVSNSVSDTLTAENSRLRADLARVQAQLDRLKIETAAQAEQDHQRIDQLQTRVDKLLTVTAEQAHTIHILEAREQLRLMAAEQSAQTDPGVQVVEVDPAPAAEPAAAPEDWQEPVPPIRKNFTSWLKGIWKRL